MPGMLDTVLNLGLNDEAVDGLARQTADARFAWDSYRRLLQMFGDVVRGLPSGDFEDELGRARDAAGASVDTELTAVQLRELCERFKRIIADAGDPFPQDPREQLREAIVAVFESWNGERAPRLPPARAHSRRLGHRRQRPADGVRQPRRRPPGRASRSRATRPTARPSPPAISSPTRRARTWSPGSATPSHSTACATACPTCTPSCSTCSGRWSATTATCRTSSSRSRTGKLFLLQTRTAKRPAQASVRFACDAVAEGMLDRSEALATIDADALEALLHPTFDPDGEYRRAGPRRARLARRRPGAIVFTARRPCAGPTPART